ncbi:hypothetical protein EB151_14715, partial [archaeon]|nr:hypothetical protein [archaeon]
TFNTKDDPTNISSLIKIDYSGFESDNDDDGIVNSLDNCPDTYNPNQEDSNGDGIGDACDLDSDGILNDNDNCPENYNPDQKDTDEDGIGDVCDDPIKYDIAPLTFEVNKNVKVHLIENPFAYLNDDQTRMINGFVQYGAPFTSDVIQIDLNEDGKMDIINGTILFKDFNEDLVDLGHATLPIYMQHNGDFNFSLYMNPNYKQYSLLHAIQDYLVSDINNDGIDELILGGEHLHLMNQGRENTNRAVKWFNKVDTSIDLKNINHDDPQTESKFNRYYSIENGLLVDQVINFNGGSFDFPRDMLVSNSGMALTDINNDEKLDVVYHNQAEIDGQVVDTYLNK